MKKQSFAAVAAALVLGAPFAHAFSTFNLELRGSGQAFEAWRQPQPNGDPYWPAYWMGGVTVQTVSGADGTYTGTDLELVDYASNWWGFTYHGGDTQYWQYDTDGEHLVGAEPGASVTISGGKVTSIDLVWDWPYSTGVTIDGLSMYETGWPAVTPNSGDVTLTGVLTPIPEPDSAALLLVGLAGLAARRVRKP